MTRLPYCPSVSMEDGGCSQLTEIYLMKGCNPLYLHGILIIILMLGTEEGWGGGADVTRDASTSSSESSHMRFPAVQFPVVFSLVAVHEADPPPVGHQGRVGALHERPLVVSIVSHHLLWDISVSSHHSNFLGPDIEAMCSDCAGKVVRTPIVFPPVRL